MNDKALRTLEYNKIKEILIDMAYSPMAKERLNNLMPICDIEEINKRQKEVSGARDMITYGGNPSFGDLKNIDDALGRLESGASLSIGELLMVLRVMQCSSSTKQYYNENGNKTSKIENLFINITTLIDTQNEIRRCILTETEIADEASVELRNIRRQIKMLEGRVKEKLNEMINSSTYRTMLQDPVITVKQDRFCLPVKVEYKGQLKGIIHEQSTSGATVFIEPLQVVDIKNKVKEFEKKEEEEIERILYRLSWMINEQIDILKNNYNILIILDTIFAKAKLSKKYNCIEPKFNTNLYINLKDARHPLIDPDVVVPINVALGKEKDYTSLIITGPNTGGKTVTLKTIGLFTLMGQAGLHIPAYDGSELSVFNEVFSDIGDEQSIEQSLSTFSSHMTNIVDILSKVTDRSLVLFDEIGAGTDPIEGAALATSILKKVKDKGARLAATTHYSELKHYALTEPGVTNAACEFDLNSLKPTYRLLVGVPGKSNAFEISKKLGLSEDIIESSRKLLNTESIQFEDVMQKIEDSKQKIDEEKKNAEEYKLIIENQKRDFEYKLQKQKEEKEKILNTARAEALKIVEDAKANAKEIISELKAKAKSVNEVLNDADMSKLKGELEKSSKELEAEIQKEKEASYKVNSERVKVKKGMEVYISNLDKLGTILEMPDDRDQVLVSVGIMKMKVNMKYVFKHDTGKVSKSKKYVSVKTDKIKSSKFNSAKMELNVIGCYPSVAIEKVDKFIDDAIVSNLEQIRIVHGKGAGILRKEIHKFLNEHPSVVEFRLGEFGEGDSGVTIAKLR